MSSPSASDRFAWGYLSWMSREENCASRAGLSSYKTCLFRYWTCSFGGRARWSPGRSCNRRSGRPTHLSNSTGASTLQSKKFGWRSGIQRKTLGLLRRFHERAIDSLHRLSESPQMKSPVLAALLVGITAIAGAGVLGLATEPN